MSGNQSDVGTRVRTACWLVGALLVLLTTKVTFPGFGVPLALAVTEGCILIACYEVFNLLKLRVGLIGGAAVTAPVGALTLTYSYALIQSGGNISEAPGGWAVIALAGGLYVVGGVAGALFHRSGGLQDIEVMVVGIVVSAWLLVLGGGGLLLIVGKHSLYPLVTVITAVALNDIAAYFGGRTVGGPKVAPLVSPGKTVSGSVLGLLVGTVLLVLIQLCGGLIVMDSPSWAGSIASSLAVVAGAQIGDLAKSLLKRGSKVKDSGAIFPGHGGMLDRLDGIFGGFAALIVYRSGYLLWSACAVPLVGLPLSSP